MPTLIPRTVTPRPFRQLATYSPSCLRVQVRYRHDSAATESPEPQTELKENVNEDAPLLRVRKHGFRALPVSPLMRGDGARKQRRQSAPQDDSLKEFQKEVALNPYAQALATPVRFCNLTLARLPSHFLLPFTTTIERVPATTNGNDKVKARIRPGRSAECKGETLAQTSYVLNRQDMVRHLSRKRHWTILITDRQKTKLASIAHRSPSAQKLVQDHWVWDEQVDATAAMLEREVVTAVMAMLKPRGQEASFWSPSSAGCHAFALKVNHSDAGDIGTEAQVQTDGQVYDLPTLLSPETLSALKAELAQDVTDTICVAKSSAACQAQLALTRLKVYKESNEIAKELPQVQNPVGSREAKWKKRMELGARSEDEDESE